MSENCLHHAIAQYNQSKGINKTTIHGFRRTFATEYLKNGGNLLKLKKNYLITKI